MQVKKRSFDSAPPHHVNDVLISTDRIQTRVDSLVTEMLEEVSRERGALPLLAFAAAGLWERRDPDEGLLTRAATRGAGVEKCLRGLVRDPDDGRRGRREFLQQVGASGSEGGKPWGKACARERGESVSAGHHDCYCFNGSFCSQMLRYCTGSPWF